ncbi:MAG: hypothetical protein NXI09_11200 [Bacteroidetes bacterium]|nr:hypothetical protein [Bacteroidota bacterium]
MNKNYDQISDFLGQLEILALHQHKKAVKLLFSKELEDATNAASTQHLYLIRASFNWFVLGIKDEEQWL